MQNAMIPNRDPLFFFWPQEYQNREKQKKNNRDDTCNSVSSFFWQISNASFCFVLLNSSLLRRSFQSRNKLIKKARKFALEILRGIIKPIQAWLETSPNYNSNWNSSTSLKSTMGLNKFHDVDPRLKFERHRVRFSFRPS